MMKILVAWLPWNMAAIVEVALQPSPSAGPKKHGLCWTEARFGGRGSGMWIRKKLWAF